jgi:ABC-type branched-subunit amino acid transport system substrate-binding protein
MNTRTSRLVRLAVFFTAVTVVIAACGGGASTGPAAGQPIRLAVIAPLTGDYQTYGEDQYRGVELAVARINAAGGVGGRLLEAVQEDSGGDPARATAAIKKVIDDDSVLGLIGPTSTNETFAALPVINQIGVPNFLTMGTPIEPGAAGRNVFQTSLVSNEQSIDQLLRGVVAREGSRRIAFVGQGGQPLSKTEQAAVADLAPKLGTTLTGSETVGEQDTDFTSVVTKLLQGDPDLIYVSLTAQKAAPFMKAAVEQGFTGRFVGTKYLTVASIFQLAGGAVWGWYTLTEWNPTREDPLTNELVSSYAAKYTDRPMSSFTTNGYDQVLVLAAGLAAAGENPTRESVTNAIRSLPSIEGASMDYSFSGPGAENMTPTVTLQVMGPNGTFETLPAATSG